MGIYLLGAHWTEYIVIILAACMWVEEVDNGLNVYLVALDVCLSYQYVN